MKNLVLFRHGETETDKRKESRGLTEKGINEVRFNSYELMNYLISCKDVCIIHSLTYRTELTAKVISDVLSPYFDVTIHKGNLRIINADSLRNLIKGNEKKGIRPAKTYLELVKYKGIESPRQLALRWEAIVKKYNNFDVVILISHEASLEAFLENATRYRIKAKSFKDFFEYADYCVMEVIEQG